MLRVNKSLEVLLLRRRGGGKLEELEVDEEMPDDASFAEDGQFEEVGSGDEDF